LSKYLATIFWGVCIDECLTWSIHIKVNSSKIATHIGIIRKISHLLSNNTLINVYYSMINPYLIFGNIVWTANYDTRMQCLVLLQKKAIRVIARDKYLHVAHTQPRFREFNIMKFESINIYLTGIFVYKDQNNHLPKMFLNYIVKITDKHDHYTRYVTSMGLSVKYCRTNYRGFSLFIRGYKI